MCEPSISEKLPELFNRVKELNTGTREAAIAYPFQPESWIWVIWDIMPHFHNPTEHGNFISACLSNLPNTVLFCDLTQLVSTIKLTAP